MALQLLLLRHAKSSWSDPSLDDHSRPLNKRGQRAAKIMADALLDKGLKPDLILSSTAERTRQTAAPIMEVWPDVPIAYENDLYLATTAEVLRILKRTDTADRVLLIGHNPTMEDLAQTLLDPKSPHDTEALANVRAKYPTGALAVFSLNCESWRDLKPQSAQLLEFHKPRDYDVERS